MNTVISFSCPAHLAMRLNEENIPERKKSQWITDAIKTKLDGKTGIFAHSRREVLMRSVTILQRENPALAKLVLDYLNSENPNDD